MSREYRIVVVGAGGVGKSAITVRFTGGNFVEKYDPTIEDSYRKSVEVDGNACMLDIMDTAGQGFVLVYSVTSNTSFEAVPKLRQEIIKCKEDTPDIPIMLAGNKIDMEAERVVKTEDGQAAAAKLNMTFIECSAKTNANINDVFFELVRAINKWREKHNVGKPAEAKKKKGCQLF